jgi:ubiquinone/menaquinone biosynthesis C-methylase UbiE
MSGGHGYDEAAARRLEAVYQTPDVVAQRHRTLTVLEPREGEHILDIGSGPGLLVADLAAVVGHTGHVTGVEISDSMLALSRRRIGSHAVADRVTFVKGDAAELPFPDGSFDAATSTQVYEYLPDVDKALAELYRVLRPGGRALILDTDWASLVWNATDQDRMDRIVAAYLERFADPHLPRSLSGALRTAGFRIHRRDTLALLNPEYDPNSFSVANIDTFGDHVTSRGRITPDEVQAWRKDLAQLGAEGRYFFSLNRYLFLADKPA